MINGIGKSGAGRIEPQRSQADKAGAAGATLSVGPVGTAPTGPGGVVAALVSQGAPVDTDKVSALRQAIAEGRYRVDPELIADKMIAADLGR